MNNLLEYFLAPRVSEEDLPSLLMDVNVRRTLSCQSLVKSQLRYLTQVWSPNQFLLKAKIERVQRRATRWILQTRVDELFNKERLVTLNLLPLALDRELKNLHFTRTAFLALLTLTFQNIRLLLLAAVQDKVILSILKLLFSEPVLLRPPILIQESLSSLVLIVLISYGILSVH